MFPVDYEIAGMGGRGRHKDHTVFKKPESHMLSILFSLKKNKWEETRILNIHTKMFKEKSEDIRNAKNK